MLHHGGTEHTAGETWSSPFLLLSLQPGWFIHGFLRAFCASVSELQGHGRSWRPRGRTILSVSVTTFAPMPELTHVFKAFLVLFAVIDIIGGIPVILQVREKAGKIYPARATIVSGSIMIVFLYLGETILGFLGIDVNSFAVAGAFVLFFIALEMTLGVRLFKEDSSAPGLSDDPKVYSVVPLAFPVIAGSGTITTILSLRAEFSRPEILVAILMNLALVVTVLLLTNRIERLLGRVGLIVLRKAFGVILLAISVKLFAGNITYLFPQH